MGIITVLTDEKNHLTKTFLNDGTSGAYGHLVKGTGETLNVTLEGLSSVIENLTTHQCLCVGEVVGGMEKFDISCVKVAASSGTGPDGLGVTRTEKWFGPPVSGPGFMLFDFDIGDGGSDGVKTIEDGIELLYSIDPGLREVGILGVHSVSSLRGDDRVKGFHLYIECRNMPLVKDYGRSIVDRLLLNGMGYVKVVRNSGAKRIKAVIDPAVWMNWNREIFECPPICMDGKESRKNEEMVLIGSGQLDLIEGLDRVRLSKEEHVLLKLKISDMKLDPDVVRESTIQKKAGIAVRKKRKKEISGRRKIVSYTDWTDKNEVTHSVIGASEYIKDNDGNDIKVLDIMLNIGEWKDKGIPDPVDPYVRGDESTGTVGRDIARVREGQYIFSFYGDVEYALVWDFDSISEIIDGARSASELTEDIETVFDTDEGWRVEVTPEEMDSLASLITAKNKDFGIQGKSSKYGTDSRKAVKALKLDLGGNAGQSIGDTTETVEGDDSVEVRLAEMNAKYGITIVGSQTRVVEEWFDKDIKNWTTRFLPVKAVAEIEMNNQVYVERTKRMEKVFDLWLEHRDRNTYTGVRFAPDSRTFKGCGCRPVIKQGGDYNLWQGFHADLGRAKSCKKILWHLEHVWCGGNTEMYEYILKWLSQVFQHPERPLPSYIVLQSGQGAGKNIIIDNVICRLLGPHALSTGKGSDITGRFNALMGVNVFTFVNEAFYAGDKSDRSQMKTFVDEYRTIERKNIDSIRSRNCTKLIFASNSSWVAPAEIGDRRYVYPAVSDVKANDKKYFGELMEEIEDGGREAFLDFMLNHKSEIDLRVLPTQQSEQKLHDVLQGADPVIRFLYDLTENGYEQWENLDGIGGSGDRLDLSDLKGWEEHDINISNKNLLVEMFMRYCDTYKMDRRYTDSRRFFAALSGRGLYANKFGVRREGFSDRPIRYHYAKIGDTVDGVSVSKGMDVTRLERLDNLRRYLTLILQGGVCEN